MRPAVQADPEEIRRTLEAFFEPGQVVELRALEVSSEGFRRRHTVSGYFDDHEALARAAVRVSPDAKAVYVTVNEINPALLSRACNRTRDIGGQEPTTSDTDVVRRRWLLVDGDPVRPSGISSSEAEHEAALTRVEEIARWLASRGWPEPLSGDSSNGGHLLYSIDLPADDGGLVQRCLAALALLFDDDVVTIDQKVFNPARIWKLYGTVSRKGDDNHDRPHRVARLLHAPESADPVSLDQLHALAEMAPKASSPQRGDRPAIDIDEWIGKYGLASELGLSGPHVWQNGRKWTGSCPWNQNHRSRSFYIVQFPSGAIAAGCHHNSCSGKAWRDLREQYEPPAPSASRRLTSEEPHVDGVEDRVEKAKPTLRVQPLSDFEPEEVDWLWEYKIPKKKITFVVGDPGLGKSTITLDIAARVSVGGPWPNEGGRAEQGNVLVFSAEDGIADTIRPRVDGLGGDAARIFVLPEPVVHDGNDQEGLDLRRHLDPIEAEVVKHDIKLLIVDPVLAFTGAVNTHKAAEVRAMLSPLAAMAERHGLAVLGVMHLNKRSGDDNPAYRVSASLDFVGVARSVFLVAKHPENPQVRYLSHFKSNLGPITKTMVYKFGEDGVLAWHGTADVEAKTLLAPPRPRDDGEAPEREEAKEWLLETLDGGPLAADVVLRSAKQAGIAERTLRRAKAELRVAAKQKEKGVGKPWFWWPPDADEGPGDKDQQGDAGANKTKDETATPYMFAEPWQPRGPEAQNWAPPTEVAHETATRLPTPSTVAASLSAPEGAPTEVIGAAHEAANETANPPRDCQPRGSLVETPTPTEAKHEANFSPNHETATLSAHRENEAANDATRPPKPKFRRTL